jgi:hypothetical protein
VSRRAKDLIFDARFAYDRCRPRRQARLRGRRRASGRLHGDAISRSILNRGEITRLLNGLMCDDLARPDNRYSAGVPEVSRPNAEQGPAEQVYRSPQAPYTQTLLASALELDRPTGGRTSRASKPTR